MNIKEIKNKRVKLSPRSITVKDDEDKTQGIVKAVRWDALPPRKQFDFAKLMKDSGLWGTGNRDRVYVFEDKLYFLFDLRYVANYYKYFENMPDETKHFAKKLEVRNKAEEIINVIDCYIIQ